MEKSCLITSVISAVAMIVGIIIMLCSPDGRDTVAMIGAIVIIVSIIAISFAFGIVAAKHHFNPVDPNTWF